MATLLQCRNAAGADEPVASAVMVAEVRPRATAMVDDSARGARDPLRREASILLILV